MYCNNHEFCVASKETNLNIYSLNCPKIYEVSEAYFKRKLGDKASPRLSDFGIVAFSLANMVQNHLFDSIQNNTGVKRYCKFASQIISPLIYRNDGATSVVLKLQLKVDSCTRVLERRSGKIHANGSITIETKIAPNQTFDVYFLHCDVSFDISVEERIENE